ERDVLVRMPVPRRDDGDPRAPSVGEITVRDRHDLVAAWYREASARQKILLHVDHDQRVAGTDSHCRSVTRNPNRRHCHRTRLPLYILRRDATRISTAPDG